MKYLFKCNNNNFCNLHMITEITKWKIVQMGSYSFTVIYVQQEYNILFLSIWTRHYWLFLFTSHLKRRKYNFLQFKIVSCNAKKHSRVSKEKVSNSLFFYSTLVDFLTDFFFSAEDCSSWISKLLFPLTFSSSYALRTFLLPSRCIFARHSFISWT